MGESQTLLFTDVVDSTQLNEALGDGPMGRLWQAHDTGARELMREWRGREVARSDGFLVLFATASDASAFAVAYHDMLHRLEPRLKARVGIHTGQVVLRENAEAERARGAPQFEVDGVALPVAARVMATAVGRQTLVTAPTLQALGTSPLRVKGHGFWRLKGLNEPVELFEIGDDSAEFEPPPDSAKAYRVVRSASEWSPARAIANNLPAERDAFVGRTDALQSLATLLEGASRLVTLLGIGGIGKTRLALRHARAWLGDYPGGAWFCDLSPARGLDGIVSAVAQALDVPLGKGDPVQQIAAAIAARGPCLVILDTFEQVARHAESTLGVWLEHAAEARFIVTSREVLGIVGEQTLVLPPLPVDEAAALFQRRAGSTVNRLAPSSGEDPAISRLVKLLDGLPLAIELAAARSRLMSPSMLLERMSERFTLLAARGGRLDRQVTLRATLDWSWDLLSSSERAALGQLSVFEGGFTLEAAESIVSCVGGERGSATLDLLQSLLDKSFVRRVGDYRFDLLQSVQEYASEHLRAEGRFEGSGPAAALDAEVRHGSYFGGLSEHQVTVQGCVELDNVIAACRRAVKRGDCAIASETVVLAWAALELRGPFRIEVELASLVLAVPGLPSALAAEVHVAKARALKALGAVTEARASFEAALASARGTGARQCEAKSLSNLGSLATNSGDVEAARALLSEGLHVASQIGDATLQCELHNNLGTLDYYIGREDTALAHFEHALAFARAAKNRRWEGGILGNLGNIHHASGRIATARMAYDAALVVAREVGNRQWEGNALCNLGLLHHFEGHDSEARATLDRSLQVAREMGHARLEAIALCNLGLVEESAHPELAQQYFESALAIASALGDRRSQGQVLGSLGVLHTRQGRVQEGRRLLDEGRSLLEAAHDDADLALLLCKSAEAFLMVGDKDRAALHRQEASAVAERLGTNVPLELKTAIGHLDTRLPTPRCPGKCPTGDGAWPLACPDP